MIAPPAPAERLAFLRILVCGFVTAYLAIRLPVYVGLADNRASRFEPLGILSPLREPLPDALLFALIATTLLLGIVATSGLWYRMSGPLFALVVLVLLTYRSSWGQILWFEILMTLHLIVVGLAPAADALSLRDRRPPLASPVSPRYGWPIRLVSIVTVVTYAVAGVAKLRYGGIEWIVGDTIRNHIAFSAVRLEVLGGRASPLAEPFVAWPQLAPVLAIGAVLLELGAPIALAGGRTRTLWVVGTWAMHVLIAATMFVVFPFPLFGVAFASFFPIEEFPARIRRG